MMDLDRTKLIKLLNLTQSAHDHEALGAIRHSNDMLDRAKISWDQLVGEDLPKPAVPQRPGDAAWKERSPEPTDFSAAFFATGERAKKQAKARIRAFPVVLRLIFFPVWLTAEAYAHSCVGEKWPAKLFTFLWPIIAALITGALWVAAVVRIAEDYFWR